MNDLLITPRTGDVGKYLEIVCPLEFWKSIKGSHVVGSQFWYDLFGMGDKPSISVKIKPDPRMTEAEAVESINEMFRDWANRNDPIYPFPKGPYKLPDRPTVSVDIEEGDESYHATFMTPENITIIYWPTARQEGHEYQLLTFEDFDVCLDPGGSHDEFMFVRNNRDEHKAWMVPGMIFDFCGETITPNMGAAYIRCLGEWIEANYEEVRDWVEAQFAKREANVD